jgi:hypothetical protein
MLRRLAKLLAGGFKSLSDLVILLERWFISCTRRNRLMRETVEEMYLEAQGQPFMSSTSNLGAGKDLWQSQTFMPQLRISEETGI